MAERTFPQLAEELKQTAAKLQETSDADLCRELLQNMRLLLREAASLNTQS